MRGLMFRKAGTNVTESDEGFSVEVLGRSGILYREGKRTMSVGAEVLATGAPAGIAIWSKSICRWNPPHQDDIIEDVKRLAIIENIRQAIRLGGEEIEVI